MSDEPKMMTIDLYGQSLTLPEDQAKALIAGRDDNKQRMTDLQTSMEAKAAAETKAIEDADIAAKRVLATEAAGKGNLDQMQALHEADLLKLRNQNKNLIISTAVAGNDKIARSAVSDVVAALSANDQISMVDNNLIVTNADTTRTTFDDYLTSYISERPHFTAHTTPPSSNGASSNNGVELPSITREEYNNSPLKHSAAIGKGELIVKD